MTIDFGYDKLPEVDLVICNVLGGPAWEVSFEFSAPIESGDGSVFSNLPLFKRGFDYLAPEGEIGIRWDKLSRLLSRRRDMGIHEGVSATLRYRDLAGRHYETVSKLNPFIFEHGSYIRYGRIDDLVDAVEDATEKLSGDGQGDRMVRPRKSRPSAPQKANAHTAKTNTTQR